MSKRPASIATVHAFMKALYPDHSNLAMAAFDEDTVLKFATDRIRDGHKGEGFEVVQRPERVLEVTLCYPRNDETRVTTIEVGLMDVRASDNIRISYDFQRDGWAVKQASTFEWPIEDPVCDADWQEVAFIQAWGREKK